MIDQEFWALFPEAQINCLVVKNINNVADAAHETFFTDLLKNSKEQAKRYLTTDTFSENQVIQEWRSAFQQFKTKKVGLPANSSIDKSHLSHHSK